MSRNVRSDLVGQYRGPRLPGLNPICRGMSVRTGETAQESSSMRLNPIYRGMSVRTTNDSHCASYCRVLIPFIGECPFRHNFLRRKNNAAPVLIPFIGKCPFGQGLPLRGVVSVRLNPIYRGMSVRTIPSLPPAPCRGVLIPFIGECPFGQIGLAQQAIDIRLNPIYRGMSVRTLAETASRNPQRS